MLGKWERQFLSPPLSVLLSSAQTLEKLNINNDEPPFIFTLQMLAPSTEYRGKMRARVNMPHYDGPWSEWSEEFTWKTENGTFMQAASVRFSGPLVAEMPL